MMEEMLQPNSWISEKEYEGLAKRERDEMLSLFGSETIYDDIMTQYYRRRGCGVRRYTTINRIS